MQITITGIGTGQVSSKAVMLPPGASGRQHAKAAAQPSAVPLGLDVQQGTASTVDVGTAGNGTRYFTVIYQVRNAQYCNTPGSCTPYTSASNNLTLLAVNVPGNINNTAISAISLQDGSSSAATQALATSLLPTHGMEASAAGTGVMVQPGLASMQVYSESEISSIPVDPGANYLYPYGYVVSNVNATSSRALPASPASGDYEGSVAFSFGIPLQSTAAADPFSITMVFDVIDDANTRVTESAQEQDYAGDLAAIARASALGSADIAVLGGRAAQSNLASMDPICTVRTAGAAVTPPAAPAAYLVNAANGGATVGSAPYNLQGLPTNSAINAGFCTPMNAAGFGTMVVSGSQSGLRSGNAGVAYTGTYSANSAGNILSFTPTQPFLVGETVSYTLTSGLTASGSMALTPFVGSFVVGTGTTITSRTAASSGTLAGTSSASVGIGPSSVAVGDFNGDGYPDLAVVNTGGGSVTILYNNKSGGFPETANGSAAGDVETLSVGSSPRSVTVGDFNGDGYPDLAVTNFVSSSVTIFYNNGSGGFAATTSGSAAGDYETVSVGTQPGFIAVGDFNGDGHPDLALANYEGQSVTILYNDGSGGFAETTSGSAAGDYETVNVGTRPESIALGDFNGDGHPDLALADYVGNSVTILYNNGSGGFAATTTGSAAGDYETVSVGTEPYSVAVGDFNGDGYPDLAVTNFRGNNLQYLLNGGASSPGKFASSRTVAVGSLPISVAVGDFNGDGRLDAVVTTETADAIDILTGQP